MPPKSAKFFDGERVLCFHGPLLYEAKCMKPELRDNGKNHFYLIHYNGWNKHWDEWVPETRVLKYNEANLQRQKDLLKQHGKDKTKRGKMSKFLKPEREKGGGSEQLKKAEPSPTATTEPKKKKSRVDPTVEPEDAYVAKVEVCIKIPDELKPILVDDWDLVTRQKQVFHLPAKVPVSSILDSYVNKQTEAAEKKSILHELTSGIMEYFNTMLGSQLLYKFERPQYSDIVEQLTDKSPSQIYGLPHLLRLFVRLGPMLSYTSLGEKNMGALVEHLQDFLLYISENVTSFFDSNQYEAVPADYHRKS